MSCRKGGLIIQHHNDLVNTWGQLCSQALTPTSVSDEPLIQQSRDMPVEGTNRTIPSPELRGDLAVHGFWTRGQTAIFDIRITDADQPTNRNTDPSKILLRHEKEKKTKYGELCIAKTPHIHSIGLFSRWTPWQGSYRSIKTSRNQPCSQMETFVFRDLWFCSLKTLHCSSALLQPLPPCGPPLIPPFPQSNMGLRYRSGIISNVISSSLIHFTLHAGDLIHQHHSSTSLHSKYYILHKFYITTNVRR